MTSSGSNQADPTGDLTRRAKRAFDVLCGGDNPVGIAVSGGSDSLALLMLAAEWAEERGRRIAAATVDHGLRPEAAGEARGVAHVCADLGIPHSVLSWRRAAGGGAVAQAEARRARHVLLAGWADDNDIALIALGHTRDDRIETFLMRARQGSGWHGLAGPMPAGPSPVWPEGRGLKLIRPLLAFGRAELRDELRGRGRDWIEDPSNEAERFERVRMRALVRKMDADASAQALRVMNGLAGMRAAVIAEARMVLEKLPLNFSSPERGRSNDHGALSQHRPGGGPSRRSTDGVAPHPSPTDQPSTSTAPPPLGGGESKREAIIPFTLLKEIGAEARLRLIEALVMAAGGAESPPRREALERLVARLCSDEGPATGVTLAGAWVRLRHGEATISQAPARQGAAPSPGLDWDRARALLADPRVEALVV